MRIDPNSTKLLNGSSSRTGVTISPDILRAVRIGRGPEPCRRWRSPSRSDAWCATKRQGYAVIAIMLTIRVADPLMEWSEIEALGEACSLCRPCSSSPSRPGRCTSSPSRAWATCSSREPASAASASATYALRRPKASLRGPADVVPDNGWMPDDLTTGWEPSTPVDDTILRRYITTFADRLMFVAQRTTGRTRRTDAAVFADPASSYIFDNAVLLLQPPTMADVREVVADATSFFPDDRTWVLLSAWPTCDLRDDGLDLVGHPPFMVRPPGGAARQAPAELTIVRVDSAEDLRVFDEVLTEGYPMPAGGAITDEALLGGPITFWIGYVDGSPVAVSGACRLHGVIEVEWVATLERHRGRGYGAALTAVAATSAPEPAALISSDLGRPVYERLGFLPMFRWTLWWRVPA